MEDSRKIFIEGIPVDSIKDDQKLTDFFEQFDDTIFRVAEKKFKAMCKRMGIEASLTVFIKIKEE